MDPCGRMVDYLRISVTDRCNERCHYCLPEGYKGWEPAKYYRLKHTDALVGFIGALTTPHFCETCNKMRLTADGKIRHCLGDHGELDLRAVLREVPTDADVRDVILSAMKRKPLEHRFLNQYLPGRPMTATGG